MTRPGQTSYPADDDDRFSLAVDDLRELPHVKVTTWTTHWAMTGRDVVTRGVRIRWRGPGGGGEDVFRVLNDLRAAGVAVKVTAKETSRDCTKYVADLDWDTHSDHARLIRRTPTATPTEES